MTNQEFFDIFNLKYPQYVNSNEDDSMIVIETEPKSITEILTYCKNEPLLDFNFLTTLCAIHYPNSLNREYCMMYQIYSMVNKIDIRFKCYLSKDNISIDSIIDIYPAANWMERQEFDFFGVNFVGHPNLTRILNEENLDVFPMRKEYRLEDATREDKEDKFFGR